MLARLRYARECPSGAMPHAYFRMDYSRHRRCCRAWGIVSYNRLVAMRQQCNQTFADIDVQLSRRHDLVPNLVETVKGYAGHERGTLDAVVQARNAAVAAQGPAAKAQAETMLGRALRQLFALAEAYPNLKANGNFQQLQTDLTGIENKLAAARHFFNGICIPGPGIQ